MHPIPVPAQPRSRRRSLAALAALLACAPSCALHHVDVDRAPPMAVPAGYAAGGGGADAAPDRWWTVFDDPALTALIERAVGDNFQIRAAWARVAQVRALGRQLDATFPEVSLSASGTYARQRQDLAPDGHVTGSAWDLSLGAAYEVDLWRRLGSAQKAAFVDAAALRDDVLAIAMTLAAQVTEIWLDVRAAQARRAIVDRQLALNQATLGLLEERLREGLGNALDVYQQRTLVAQSRSQLIAAEATVTAAAGQLAVLLGTSAGDVEAAIASAPASLPALPPLPAAGVPVDLLVRRPDIRAAQRRAVAADYRIAAAVADRLPSLRLQGSVNIGGDSIIDSLTGPFFALIASLTAPLFDNGRRAAAVDEQRAVLDERIAGFGQALVVAMAEVEGSLAQEKHQLALIAELAAQAQLTAATSEAARERFRDGDIDYLPVLTAIQGEQRIELAALDAHRQQLSLRVQLYRALGGTWADTLTPTVRSDGAVRGDP